MDSRRPEITRMSETRREFTVRKIIAIILFGLISTPIAISIHTFGTSLAVEPALPGSARLTWKKIMLPGLTYTIEKQTKGKWELETAAIPKKKDFTAQHSYIKVGDETFEFISGFKYKDKELERNYSEEDLIGKAAYSMLLGIP